MDPKSKDLANLLNRAAAALETPLDLTPLDITKLVEDLTVAATQLGDDDRFMVTLDPNNTDDVPEDLYEYLVDQFVAKAAELGQDVVNDANLLLDNWEIRCEVVTVIQR